MEIKTGIITCIKEHGMHGASSTEISRELGNDRHTLAKYLNVLGAEGKIAFKRAGMGKIWFTQKSPLESISKEQVDTAGTGLTLSGGQFSLTAGYRLPQGCSNGQIAEWNGSAWVCGNDDVGSGGGPHNHLGETWTGSNNPLVIDGSFSDAPLVLGNDDGAGLFVGWANDDGVYVDAAGDDGVYVYSAGNPSTETASSSHNGFEVAGAEGNGLYVGRADNHGVRVSSAGNAGLSVSSAWNGVVVGFAGDDGFYVYSANDDGVFVDTAGDDGVFVKWAGDDGVYVHSAGNPSDRNPSAGQNGFEVAGAEGFGLYVGRADVNGVEVNSAGYDGIYVLSADRRAATFNGDVLVTGYLTKQGGGFKIDHPLDPQNQYLNHSFVEAPDMMNIYNGNVILDANREAWVELPDWFEALNQDYRYQLTAIGGPGPGLPGRLDRAVAGRHPGGLRGAIAPTMR